MSYLFIINIGPVQEFIASARRSQDLWFGSWLLSDLSKAAAKAIVEIENNQESLIFPAPNDPEDLNKDSSFDVANKIVAIIKKEPKEVAAKVLNAVKERLQEIKELAFRDIRSYINNDVTDKQIDDMLEFFWVAKALDKDYYQTRKDAEALMAARKTTRNYNNVSWGSREYKSSLDGQRESVIATKICESDSEKRRKLRISEGERLCGVGLLKRLGQDRKGANFYSTSHVASLPFISLFDGQVEPLIKNYTDKLIRLGVNKNDFRYDSSSTVPKFDGHILYEERLSDYFDKSEKAKVDEAKEALKCFYDDFGKLLSVKKRPSPYYGLLLADGDRMGEAIDNQKDPEAHQRLSKALSRFAEEVRKIVKEYNGCLVYAGGDDVLAFLPVNTILKCARALADDFKERLKIFSTKDTSPTLSVGIAIVHHLDPLGESLELVRKAEKMAKSVLDKNAIAITLSKRGGVDLTIKGKWNHLDTRLHQWIELHRNEQLPKGVAYELRDLVLSLGLDTQMPSKNDEQSNTMIINQVIRILKRKRVSSGQAIDDQTITLIKEKLGDSKADEQRLSVKEVSDEIIVAGVFSDAIKLASAKKEGEK